MVESWTCHWEGASLAPQILNCWLWVSVHVVFWESSPELPADAVCDIISWVVAKLQQQHPNPLMETSEGSYHTFLSATCLSADLYLILLSVTAADLSTIMIISLLGSIKRYWIELKSSSRHTHQLYSIYTIIGLFEQYISNEARCDACHVVMTIPGGGKMVPK